MEQKATISSGGLRRPPLLTAKELAELLRVDVSTLYSMARSGKIPGAFRVGSYWRFDVSKIAAWMRAVGNVTTRA